MLLSRVVDVSQRVASTSARTEKVELLADFLGQLEQEETLAAVSYLAGRPLQPRLGVGPASVHSVRAEPSLSSQLTIAAVDEALAQIANEAGPGSTRRRSDLLKALLGSATSDEQQFLRGLIVRNLRQGALEGVMAEAAAAAIGVPGEQVRRAAMVEGDLIGVVTRALLEGQDALNLGRTGGGHPGTAHAGQDRNLCDQRNGRLG